MIYKRRHVLPGAAWIDGNNIQIPVKDLPPLQRVESITLRAELVFTTGAASALINGSQFARLIQMIDLGPNIRGSGVFFDFLKHLAAGKQRSLPAAIPATNASAFRRFVEWEIPFYDRRSSSPYDDCPAGADFNDRVLSVDTAAALSLGAGSWSTLAGVTGTLRVVANLLPPSNKVSSVVQFGYADLTGQAPAIGGTGLYVDLFGFRENLGAIDSTQITQLAVSADGAQHYDQIRLAELTALWNEAFATGVRPQLDSATVPEGFEYLPEAPGVGAAAAATVTTPVLPILFPHLNYRKANSLQVEQVLRVDFTGSDTTFRVGYRRILPHTENTILNAFARKGDDVGSVANVSSATNNGDALKPNRPGLGRYLPVQRRGA